MNWIKMRVSLNTDPRIIQIADQTDLDEFGVVGRLHALWSWADMHTIDGNAVGVTKKHIDRIAGDVTGFADALARVGWLAQNGDVLTFPNFDEHNGKTAKSRAQTAKRVAAHKRKTVTQVALPREEKNREEKNIKKQTKKPPAYSPEFESWWSSYPNKQDKGRAFELFKSIPLEDHDQLNRATTHYSTATENEPQYRRQGPRFLAKDFWRDWINGNPNPAQSSLRNGCDPQQLAQDQADFIARNSVVNDPTLQIEVNE